MVEDVHAEQFTGQTEHVTPDKYLPVEHEVQEVLVDVEHWLQKFEVKQHSPAGEVFV